LSLIEGLLEGLESFKRGTKRKADSETTKPTKYRIAQTDDTVDDEESSEDDSNIFDDASEFEGFSDASEAVQQKSAPLVTPTGKYIPPAARKANPPSLPDQAQDPRLHKQIQGMLNRYFFRYVR
jgi:hypothetical protein